MALWNANLEEGLKIAKASGAKEAWSARGSIPTSHLMGGTIMGTSCQRFRRRQLWPEPRNPKSLGGGAEHLSDRGRIEPDVYDICLVTARCRAMASQWATLTN